MTTNLNMARNSAGPVQPVQLDALGAELHRLGYVVVPHGAELCVRLPLLCSVRIRADGERTRFIPKFGPFSRSGGLLATMVASTTLVTAVALATDGGPATVVAGFVGVAALLADACRFVITEGCLTRLQQLITGRS